MLEYYTILQGTLIYDCWKCLWGIYLGVWGYICRHAMVVGHIKKRLRVYISFSYKQRHFDSFRIVVHPPPNFVHPRLGVVHPRLESRPSSSRLLSFLVIFTIFKGQLRKIGAFITGELWSKHKDKKGKYIYSLDKTIRDVMRLQIAKTCLKRWFCLRHLDEERQHSGPPV